jgi:hypothetical protein
MFTKTTKPFSKIGLICLTGLIMVSAACTRSASVSEAEIAAAATEAAIATEDAGVQLTLEALLGSATVESAASATPQATATIAAPTATPTLEGVQLTALAATLAAQEGSPTVESSEASEPTASNTPKAVASACYGARYVYDQSYPDGTRVDPGQAMAKTWRLQNVGTCDWVAGQYELVFTAGDRMGINEPVTINVTVPAGGYIDFTLNMKAPSEPGKYRAEFMLRTKGGDTFGVGVDADGDGKVDSDEFTLPIWIEIVVKG